MKKVVFLFITEIILYNLAPSTMERNFMVVCLLVFLLNFISFYKSGDSKVYKMKKIYYRHSLLFCLCYFIVFFQCDLDYVLGLATEYDYFVYDEKVVCRAMALSNLCLTAILMGYCHYKRTEKKTVCQETDVIKNFTFSNKRSLLIFTIILIVIYVAFMPKEFFNNGYANKIETGAVAAISSYLIAFFIAMFVVYSIQYRKKKLFGEPSINKGIVYWAKELRYPLILVFIYSLLILISGRRTEVLRVLFVVLFSYIYCERENVNYLMTSLAGLIGIVLMSFVGVYRSLTSASMSEGVSELQNVISVLPFTKELANSVNTLHIAMSHFPEIEPYNWGTSFFPSFLKIIPMLTGFLQKVFGLNIDGSEHIITRIYFGGGTDYYGLGSSIIADTYISFGVFGSIIIFYFFGRFLRYLEIGTFYKKSSPYFLALSIACYSNFLFACRQSIDILFLCWLYACLLIYLFRDKKMIRVEQRHNIFENQ